MKLNVYLAIAVMAGVTYLIRLLPLTLIRKPIRSRFLRSFLYYVPFVTLAVMTFPAILTATASPLSAWIAFLVAVAAAYLSGNLIAVSLCACAAVFLVELFF